jgi:hypothetical protein
MRNVLRIGGGIESQGGVRRPDSDCLELVPWVCCRYTRNMRDGTRRRVEGKHGTPIAVDEFQIEADVLTDSGAVADSIPVEEIDRNYPAGPFAAPPLQVPRHGIRPDQARQNSP